jgi:glyoxylase-like metal-dependent hydrolase (beta-lactamase superfamily II)
MADWLPVKLARYLVSCADCEPRILDEGDTIVGLTVVHCPGHTPGSVCLWSGLESVLFTGDVLNNEHGIRTPPWTVNHSHRTATRAADRLSGLPFERAYFGHGPAIVEGADQRVRSYVERRQRRPAAASA